MLVVGIYNSLGKSYVHDSCMHMVTAGQLLTVFVEVGGAPAGTKGRPLLVWFIRSESSSSSWSLYATPLSIRPSRLATSAFRPSFSFFKVSITFWRLAMTWISAGRKKERAEFSSNKVYIVALFNMPWQLYLQAGIASLVSCSKQVATST